MTPAGVDELDEIAFRPAGVIPDESSDGDQEMIHSDHVAMIRSAVVAAVLVALLLLALIWHPQGVTGSGGSPPTEPAETAQQTPATVQVTLSPAEEPAPPTGQQTSLASLDEGARDSDTAGDAKATSEDTANADSAAPPPAPSEVRSPAEPSKPEPAKPPESSDQAPDEQSPNSEPPTPETSEPTETTDAQSPDSTVAEASPANLPEPVTPTTTPPSTTPPTHEPANRSRSRSSGVRAAADGAIPRLRHTGEIELVRTTWPRLEVVWVTQPPLRPDDAPRTLVEAVLDSSGHVRWQNLKTKTQSRGFSFATMRYNTGGRVRIADPTTLQLWKHRDRIASIANIPPDQTQRFQWGYYRHRAEVFELARAESAFRTAESAGQLTFDPSRSDVLEVTWGTGPKQQPTIVAARFLPGAGEPVPLKLP